MTRKVLMLALVAGCTSGEPVEDDPQEAAAGADLDLCGGEALSGSVGRPVAEISASLPDGARVIAPGSVVTQDYRPDRANVYVDQSGNVTGILCG